MNKKVKIILIIVAVVILVYIAFVFVDVVRLRNSKLGTKPLLTVSKKIQDNNVIYTGLGYNVKYYLDKTTEITNYTDYIGVNGYGAECRVLGVLIWAWIE